MFYSNTLVPWQEMDGTALPGILLLHRTTEANQNQLIILYFLQERARVGAIVELGKISQVVLARTGHHAGLHSLPGGVAESSESGNGVIDARWVGRDKAEFEVAPCSARGGDKYIGKAARN